METLCKYCKMPIHKDATTCPHCRKNQPSSITITKILFIVAIFSLVYQCTKAIDPASPTAKSNAPSAENMTVKISRMWPESDYLHAAGYVQNNNSVPAGARVKITCFDAKGEVVGVHDFWPESIRNIPAGAKSSFQTLFQTPRGMKRYEYAVTEARTW
jgi:hypothetical protein